jgi:hypothetical protein
LQNRRSWFSLVGYCVLTVVGTALALALLLAGGSVALASHKAPQSAPAGQSDKQTVKSPAELAAAPAQAENLTTVSGLVTDSYCGARHKRHSNLGPAECAATCIRSGASFVLVDGDHVYRLSGGQSSLGKLLGTRANVTGAREGDTIQVSSASPVL